MTPRPCPRRAWRRRAGPSGAAVLGVLLCLSAAPTTLPGPRPAQDDEYVETVPLKGLGKPAPKIDKNDVEWVRGRRVTSFRRGHIYVVFFWATWAPSCRDTFPLLVRLEQSHAEDRVHVIAISSWRRFGAMPVEQYVQGRSNLGAFPMARDIRGDLVDLWEDHVDLTRIPRAVVIDRTGKVVWVGHPFDDLEGVVAAVVEGDEGRLAELHEQHRDRLERANKPLEKLGNYTKWEWWEEIPAVVDEIIAINPARYGLLALHKYYALVSQEKFEEAAGYGREAVDGLLSECELQLNALAWHNVSPKWKHDEDARDLELARAAAERANELSDERDWSVLNTLARVHYLQGDPEAAVRRVQQALRETYTSEQREVLARRLAEYTAEEVEPESAGTDGG